MAKNKEFRRPLKSEKVKEGFESYGYTITQWYVDPIKNSCLFISVRNNINNIEFICLIPSIYHLPYNNGIYVYEDAVHTPDVDDAISMWNECALDRLFIKIFNKVIIRMSKTDYRVYTCKDERPDEGELDTLTRYANEMSVLNEEITKIEEASGETITFIAPERNPFDVLLDGGTVDKVESKRVEDVQPCILTEYIGYTLGQAIPVMGFVDFFNEKKNDVQNNINIIAQYTKTIYQFQSDYIKSLYEEAISNLKSFTNSVESSYSEYRTNLDDSSKDFNTLQTILEKNSSTMRVNDITVRANNTLRTLLDEQIEKRDKMIGLLDTIRRVFGEI